MPNPVSSLLPNPQSYTTTAGLVVDDVTGLTWQRDVEPNAFLWQDAKEHCAGLALAGFEDWRLPALIELVSIVDFTRTTPAIDVAAFPGMAGGNFWTSTPLVGAPGEAFYVAFSTGFSYHGHEDFLQLGARCVRGSAPPAGPSARYTFPAEGTVYDAKTRLVWQRTVDTATYSWESAAAYCKGLDLAGSAWRVPSMKELQTLLDVGQQMPALDPVAFPGSEGDSHWTSSPLDGSDTDSWYVSFWIGLTNTIARYNLSWVRCVR
jgi:hypothetical protein